MSKPIESPEDFAAHIIDNCSMPGRNTAETDKLFWVSPAAVATIQARDTAMKLEGKRALLAEIQARAIAMDERNSWESDCVHAAFGEAVIKYAPPDPCKCGCARSVHVRHQAHFHERNGSIEDCRCLEFEAASDSANGPAGP